MPMKMTSFRVFLGVLLLILCRERSCGQSVFSSGNCPYRYCSHIATYLCGSGGLVRLPCVVYNATGPIQVRWYHSQNGNPADAELNITTGDRYTVEESEQSPSNSRYTKNCTEGDQLYRNELKFNYSEGDSGSYWCRIVIDGDNPLKLSEAWRVESTSAQATCGQDSQTDPKCAVQITPILSSTNLLVQSTPTSIVRTTSEPSVSVTTVTYSPVQTPSVSSTSASSSPTSHPLGCTVGGTSCFVYLGAGLGALVVIVVLLVVVVIVLIYISLKIRKKKRKGESIVTDSKGVKSFELTELQQHPTVSVQNIGYVGANTSKQGLHKSKDKSNEYEEIDQVEEGKVSSGPHQLPANLAESQTSTKSSKEKMHPYDVVAQPTGGNAVSNDQQHIYDRTQHLGITDKTQQTHGEYNQDSTTGRSQYECLDSTRQGRRNKEARFEGHDYDSVSITEKGKHHGSETPSSQENLYHVLEGPTEENSSATTAAEDMYSTPNVSSKGQPQTPVTQDNFYHVLEGPTPPTGTSMYSNPERSTAPGKEEEHKYDDPVCPNWYSNKSGQQLGGELFDDPSYQSTFASVMSTQPYTQTELPNSARVDLLPSPPTTSSVEDKTVASNPSYQLSSPSRLPTASAQPNPESFSRVSKNAQKDDYDQPAAITIKNKEMNSNEGGDQLVLFDDLTYQVASAPV